MKNGWITKRLGDVGKTQYGLSESMNEDGKGFKIFRMGEVQEGRLIDTGRMKCADISRQEFEQYKLRTGDVLFNRTNSFELVGKTGIFALKGDYCFASYLVRLNLDRKKVLPEFVNYFMNSDRFQKSVKEKASKSINQANINATILSNELIRFPESLLEQQRIVCTLDKAFDGIATAKANAEKNLQHAHALFESHLQSVFTQHQAGWVETTIGGAIRFIDYRGKTPEKTESGLRLITAKNVKMGYLQETPMEFVAPQSYDSWMTRGIPQRSDVLFTTEAPLANVAQLDTDEKVVFAQRIIIMQPDPSRLNSTFLKYLLLSQPVQQRIQAKGTGATVKGIKASLLKTVEIFFPKAIAEQQKIVGKLDDLRKETERLKSIYKRKLAALEALKKSLLHQAFSGELT
jgi:type I restriction enzyme, S subunit